MTREYLSTAQLAELTLWSAEAIGKKVRRGEFVRGIHYFQPSGRGGQLVFKWSAIVALIEERDREAAAGSVADVARDAIPVAKGNGKLDVEKATRGLHRLLDRQS